MIVSLAELTDTAKKAVIGRGHPFGIAEDMAWATRWLCEIGLYGADKLVHALEPFAPIVPSINRTVSTVRIDGDDVPLPALTLAPSISDLLLAYRDERKDLRVNRVTHPLLLVPFIARAAQSGNQVSIQWRGTDTNPVTVICHNKHIQIFAHNSAALLQALGDSLTCQWRPIDTAVPELFSPQHWMALQRQHRDDGCVIDDKIWRKLQNFAHNSYVPINEEARLYGAGAGLTDND